MHAVRAGRRYWLQGALLPGLQGPAPYIRGLLPLQKSYATTPDAAAPNPELAGITPPEIDGARKYCLDLLRKYDAPSRTLLAFIPPPAQDAYLSLRALNIDVARIPDITSNPTIARMRMQFWSDAITRSLALTPPKEPIAILLAHAAATLQGISGGTARLSKSWLHRLVRAREERLGEPPYSSLAALETYAEHTYSTLLYLTLSALPLASITADHVASHIGKAQGIVAVLRGLPLLAFPAPPPTHHVSNAIGGGFPGATGGQRQGSVPLPLDIMAECGVREEAIFRQGAEAPGLKEAVFRVATRANDHLITAREMLNNVYKGQDVGHEFEHQDEPEHATSGGSDAGAQGKGVISKQVEELQRGFGVFMPAVATQMWLERLESADFDVFDQKLRVGEWKLPWRAYWAHRRGMF